jgi:hypothetical protein
VKVPHKGQCISSTSADVGWIIHGWIISSECAKDLLSCCEYTGLAVGIPFIQTNVENMLAKQLK